MSLATLTSLHTVTIERETVTKSDSMGAAKTYNTANRTSESLATTSTGRFVSASSKIRTQYAARDIEVMESFITTTDPAADERDRLLYDSEYYYVVGKENPNKLGMFYTLHLSKTTTGVPGDAG